MRVTLLADLDQSIYEFRQGKPETLNQLAAEYSETDRLPFTGNFRSSPAICALSSTLRGKERSKPDQPLGAAARVKTPIKILSYDGKVPSEAIGKRFAEILVGLEIPLEKSIVLAHKWRTCWLQSNAPTAYKVMPPLARLTIHFIPPHSTTQSRHPERIVLDAAVCCRPAQDRTARARPGENLAKFRIAGDTTGTLKTACLTLEERVGDLSSNDRGTEIDVTALLRTATCGFPAGDRFACRLKAKLQPRMLSR